MSAAPNTFAPITAAAMIELRAMLSAKRLAVLLAITGIAGVIGLANQVFGAVPVPEGRPDVWPAQYLYQAFLRGVLPLTTLYIGTALWSEETESGTLVYVITRPVARQNVLLAKLVVAWAVVTAVVFAGMTATAVPLAALRGSGFGGLCAASLILPVASLAWMALFALCGTLIRRSLILGLGVGFLLEMVLANFQSVARTISPGHHIGSALMAIGPYPDVPVDEMVKGAPVEPWAAWVVLLGIAAGGTVLACLQVRYKEYTPTRSD